jgi:hypothetical protein
MGATFVNVDWTISICFGVMADSLVAHIERAAVAKRVQPALQVRVIDRAAEVRVFDAFGSDRGDKVLQAA